jgi:hypothetical protein
MIAVIPRAKPEGPLKPQERSLATLGMTVLLYSFVTVWKVLEMICQRPSTFSSVR